MQSKRGSFIESIAGTLLGFAVAVLSNYLILPMFGYNVNMFDSIGIAIVFTLISFIRAYIVRRAFNRFWKHL